MSDQEFIPVYMLTGFLESGKTTMIKSMLSDEGFSSGQRTLIICCEEGTLARMPFNIYYQRGDDTIVGTIMVVGTDGDEFADCPITLGEWKQILRRWGN